MRLFGALAILALLVLPGCMSQHVVIHIKPDGSGGIEFTKLASGPVRMYLKNLRDGLAALKKAGQELPPNSEIPKGIKDLFSEEEGRKEAYRLGEDVTFVNWEPVSTDDYDGSINYYTFKDITKLKIAEGPNLSQLNPKADSGPVQYVTFKFDKQLDHSTLTAVFPSTGYKKTGDAAADAEGEARWQEREKNQDAASKKLLGEPGQAMTVPGSVPPEMIGVMKPYFQGTKLSLAVMPDGDLISTNSPFVDDTKDKKGKKVTLFDLNFESLMSQDDILKKLMFKERNIESAKKYMKDLPGCKVNPESEIKIDFKEHLATAPKP